VDLLPTLRNKFHRGSGLYSYYMDGDSTMSDQTLRQQIDTCIRKSVNHPEVFCYQLFKYLSFDSQRRVEIPSVAEFKM
jgi:hypothetical protein